MCHYKYGQLLIWRQSALNEKIVAVTLLVLMSIAVAAACLGLVFGQNQNLGVSILQVIPQGSQSIAGQTTNESSVGDALNLQGTIYTSNGQYQVIFASQIVASGRGESSADRNDQSCHVNGHDGRVFGLLQESCANRFLSVLV